MTTQHRRYYGTGTEASETSGPAGVGELATQVVINSSDNVSWKSDQKLMDKKDTDIGNNGHCYLAPLRLRGGGDNEDLEMADSDSISGDMGAGGSQKRCPTSPAGLPAKLPRTSKQPTEMNDLIGFIEQTVIQEKEKKKLGVMIAQKMLAKIARLRTVAQTLAYESSRLAGELKGKDEALQQSLTLFIDKLDTKNAKTSGLRAELDALKATTVAPCPTTAQQSSYAAKAEKTAPRTATAPETVSAPPAKSKKTADRDKINKSRKIKATFRFLVEIPQDMTVASAKAGVWQTVRAKCSNPKEKTIVSGKSLVIIPDDANTLEVMKDIGNMNAELGITAEDMGNSAPLHKLGPRDGDVVHWVMEVPPSVLAKIENKSLYVGMTRCRCKVHSSLPQCFNCQQYGHTAARCEQKTPLCRNCAGAHDSRTCKEDGVKCANCKGPHKASSAICKARSQATRSLLRRTDFGQQ
ncbi:uncharacterized protein LOC107883987 [Acyrthosiphon pisum]|uniref:CCHC-type domain-containing protein n=1 Tax=Acyrthosiphon pisum TaxID=7029 RepID=A0A8R2H5G5_ACYPI|nr:uncharacterized protein LOC107883987 [Acyrthosiphon pisum]|eukprot:XP_016660659.1 PREDICTED: uncharacterized protein LOC107883987 [Acyrthosiphon pisum]